MYAIYVDHGKVLMQIAHDRNFFLCVTTKSHLKEALTFQEIVHLPISIASKMKIISVELAL